MRKLILKTDKLFNENSSKRIMKIFIVALLSMFILPLTADAQKITSDISLIQYYSFDSVCAAKVFDNSALSLDGTIFEARVVSGHTGNALEFNDTSGYIDGNTVPPVVHFTALAWIKPYSYGNVVEDNNKLIFEKSESYYMNIMSNSGRNRTLGKIRVGGRFQTEDGSRKKWEYLDSPDTIPLNTWTHVGYTYDGNKLRMYINGKIVCEKSILPKLVSTEYGIIWGAVQKMDTKLCKGHFHGCLDECMLFLRKLEDWEIKNYYIESTTGSDL